LLIVVSGLSSSIESGSTLSESRSNSTIALCPSVAALNNGVQPSLSIESGLTPSALRSNLTIASCPFDAALNSGVWPL
ncbi:hypothetical protein EIK77_002437, partial [Talaromyces pinophilus]